MVRTQIQLTEKQSEHLKKLAAKRGVSVAQLIRESVEKLLGNTIISDPEQQRARAMCLIGCAGSGLGDLSEKHDDLFAEGLGH